MEEESIYSQMCTILNGYQVIREGRNIMKCTFYSDFIGDPIFCAKRLLNGKISDYSFFKKQI